jgi:RNase adaptor protein for sRNA GlmZ degradation
MSKDELIDAVAEDPEMLEALREEPEYIAEEFDLDGEELEALVRADQLLVEGVDNPLVAVKTYTYDTGTSGSGELSFDPDTLEDLPRERLVDLTREVLVDDEYRAEVRDYVDL